MKNLPVTFSRRPLLFSLSGFILAVLITALLFLASLTAGSSPTLAAVGRLILGSSLLFGSLLLFSYFSLRHSFHRALVSVNIFLFVLIAIYGLSLLAQGVSQQGLTSLLQLVLITGFFNGISLILRGKSQEIFLVILASVALVFFSINIALWLASGAPSSFKSYFIHPNPLGAITLFLLYFPLARVTVSRRFLRYFWLGVSCLGLVLLFATTSRSTWLAAIAIFGTYLLWNVISRNRFFFTLVPLLLYCLIAATILVYATLRQNPYAAPLNTLVREYTGKNLFSGRDRFWLDLITTIGEKPIFGYGAGSLPQDTLGITLSSHNLYLQVLLQVGFVGLFVLLLALWQVWLTFRRYPEHPWVRLSGAFFVGILVHQIFEVSLTQNVLSVGVWQWLVLAFGMATVLSKKRSQQ
jgi:O-antigen ligase